MRTLLRTGFVFSLLLIVAMAPRNTDRIEIRLSNGERWRGEVADYVEMTVVQRGVEMTLKGQIVEAAEWHVTIMTDVAGKRKRKTIFKDDIVSLHTIEALPPASSETNTTRSPSTTPPSGWRT